jgi:seryl-tRNA synthetase
MTPTRLSVLEIGEVLRAAGELIDFGGGHIGYTGRLLHLVRRFDAGFCRLALEQGAVEFSYPSSVELETAHRAHYLAHFPNQAWLLTHFEPDGDLEALAGDLDSADEAAAVLSERGGWAPPSRVANPLVCFHFYRQLAGRELPVVPLYVITAQTRCSRVESGAGWENARLSDFTMREVVLAGEPDAVAAGRERVIDATAALARETGIPFRIEAAQDPFFRVKDAARGRLQQLTGLKQELRVDLDRKALAVASFNLHLETFGEAFGIGDRSQPIHTACAGFGLERWAIAFLCHHGPDERDWPPEWRPEG